MDKLLAVLRVKFQGLSRHVKKNSKVSWIPEGHMSARSLCVDRKGQNLQHEGSVSAKNEEI